jgi:hypothetical protein
LSLYWYFSNGFSICHDIFDNSIKQYLKIITSMDTTLIIEKDGTILL